MKATIFLFGIIFLLVIAGIHVYRTAEVHTLHVTRAAFENRRKQIELLLESAKAAERLKLEAELEELNFDEGVIDKEEEKINNGQVIL